MINIIQRSILPKSIEGNITESLNSGNVIREIPKGSDRIQAVFKRATSGINSSELKHVNCSFNPIRFIASFLSYFFDFSKLIERAVKSLIKAKLNEEKINKLEDLINDLRTEAVEVNNGELAQKHPQFKPSEIRLFQQTSLTADELLQQGKGNWSKIKELARNNNEHGIPVDRIRDALGLKSLEKNEINKLIEKLFFEEPSKQAKLMMYQVYRQRILMNDDEWNSFLELLPRREKDLLSTFDFSHPTWLGSYEEIFNQKLSDNLNKQLSSYGFFDDHRNSKNQLAEFYREEEVALRQAYTSHDNKLNTYHLGAYQRILDNIGANLTLYFGNNPAKTPELYLTALEKLDFRQRILVEATLAPNNKLFSPLGGMQQVLDDGLNALLTSGVTDPEMISEMRKNMRAPQSLLQVTQNSMIVHFFANLHPFTNKEADSKERIYLSYEIPLHSERISQSQVDYYVSSPRITKVRFCHNDSPIQEKIPTLHSVEAQILQSR